MEDRTARLESAVAQLQLTVASLQQRLDALETRAPVVAAAVQAADPMPSAAAAAPPRAKIKDQYDPIAILSLAGRLLLVLAGGFFLRALTEAGTLPQPVGVGLAFAYATIWLVMAYRAGGHGLVPNAVTHALGAVMVAYPLTLEATTRFKVLGGLSSMLVVAALTAGVLFVAWRRRLRAVAWLAVVAALPVSGILLVQTGAVVAYSVYLIALGAVTLWLTYSIDWYGLRWPVALAADAAVMSVTLRAFAPDHRDSPEAAVAVQFLLLVAYLGTTAFRTLVQRRQVTKFEMAQTSATLAVVLGGAVFIAQVIGALPAVVGVSALTVGAACYAAAFAIVDKHQGHELNFHFYASLGMALVIAGFVLTGAGASAGGVLAVFAVLAAYLWSRLGRVHMLVQGAIYLVAACAVSGALSYSLGALVATPDGRWAFPDAVMVVVLVGCAIAATHASRRQQPRDGEIAVGARCVVILACIWTAGGTVIGYLAPLAGLQPDGSVDAGVLATVRTGVLSISTLAIAWMGRNPRFREWGWLVYPLLVGIGIKLMTQDFKHSRPATLFIALALYGAALIVAPRLRRLAPKAEAAASA